MLLLLLDETSSSGGVGIGGTTIDASGAGCALTLPLLLMLPPLDESIIVATSVDGLGVGCGSATDGGLFELVV